MSLDLAPPVYLSDERALSMASAAYDAQYLKILTIRRAIRDAKNYKDIYDLVRQVQKALSEGKGGIQASSGDIRLEIAALRKAGLVHYLSESS
jgi:hypothetical protein